jgi:hypothetical protein
MAFHSKLLRARNTFSAKLPQEAKNRQQ